MIAKRALDLVIAVPLLVLVSPFLLVAAIWIKLEDRGHVIFHQERVGRDGKPFQILKFRTMVENAHTQGAGYLVSAGDPRITRVGRFLRRWSLDELPQLFNILRGDMSWVGPRPEAASLEQGYVRDIEHFALRGIVRPGVTGWAQINQGYAHAPDEMRSKLEHDLYYLKHCSLWLDLVIVLRTFAVVFRGTGAR